MIDEKAASARRYRVMSGVRPTGRLHLGHLIGMLAPSVELANRHDAFYEVADLHAFTTAFEDPRSIHDARGQRGVDLAAFRADGEMSLMRLGIFGVTLAGVGGHSGSTNVSSSFFKRFRARNSLFLTVPSGSFFMVAISSYDSSAKWRS